MNLEEILKQVQVQLEISSDEIDWEDDEIKAKITLVNSAILTWATAKNTCWEELFEKVELGRIKAGENEFDLPKTVRSVCDVWTDGYNFMEIRNIRDALKIGRGVYIAGNAKRGRTLNFAENINTNSDLVGKNIYAMCMNQPTLLKKPQDRPEMSDPTFIVDYVCASIATDDDASKYSVFSANYINKLNQMIEQNNDDLYDNGIDVTIGE